MGASKHIDDHFATRSDLERQTNVMETENNRFRRTLSGVARACSLHHEPERAEAPPVQTRVWDNATEMLNDQFRAQR